MSMLTTMLWLMGESGNQTGSKRTTANHVEINNGCQGYGEKSKYYLIDCVVRGGGRYPTCKLQLQMQTWQMNNASMHVVELGSAEPHHSCLMHL